nr:MAG TPA: hypothetical protein [Caudoviricetes sp.]
MQVAREYVKPGHWGGVDTNKGLNPLSSTNFKRLNYE